MLLFPAYGRNLCILSSLLIFLVFFVKKIHRFQIHREKYADFSCKSGKLAIRFKNNYYINWKNLESEKFLIIFSKIWTEKVVDGLPNAELKVKLIIGKL